MGAILETAAQQVISGTYAEMRDRTVHLAQAVEALAAEPGSQARLDEAAEAWRAARVPWERSEAFLFGPAAFLSLDPALDSWPVDHQQLEDVLASGLELTPTFVAEGLGPQLRGFHTVEFLLFRDGRARSAADLHEREMDYLVACSAVLADDAARLWAAWAVGVDGAGPFAEEFAAAGEAGSRYLDPHSALLEMVEGMIAICDEVANGKIADPYDEQDPALVESQFSYNSLQDFQDNLRSVRNLYTGGLDGVDGPGLDDYVAARDAALDAQLQEEVAEAIAAIAAIPAPFRENLDAAMQIEAAQAAIEAVMATLETGVKPLITE